MSELLNDLASKAGVSPEQAQRGLGALLSFIKEKLPQDDAAKVEAEVPNSNEAVSAFEANKTEPDTGLLGSIGGLVGKVFGGDSSVSEISKRFSQAGFSVEQLQKFIPQLIEWLKNHVPADLLQKIKDKIPGMLGEQK